MAYDAPVASDIKTRFPVFADVDNDLITAVIAEAQLSVDDSWLESDYKPAIQYLTAHMLLTEGVLASGAAAGSFVVGGFLKSESLGDASRTYDNAGAGSGFTGTDAQLASTVYGQRFIALRNANQPAVITV